MLDKYSRIQDIVNQQKAKYERILGIFEKMFVAELGLSEVPKIEVEFGKTDKHINGKVSDNIKIKIVDKSSVKFVVIQSKEKLLKMFKQEFPNDLFKLF